MNGEGGNRAGGIRTRDLLNPIQAHYQAVLRPDAAPTITARSANAKKFSSTPRAQKAVDQFRQIVAVAAFQNGAGRNIRFA